MDTKEALTRMVKAGRLALTMDKGLRSLGYDETPYFDIYGNIADAVYFLLGEETETFSASVTSLVFESPELTDARRVSLLMRELEKNGGRCSA